MSVTTDPDRNTSTQPVMYTTTWCGYCRRLKAHLQRAGISYVEVDIEAHSDAADIVAKVNSGNLTVPTVVFADGSAMTNPSAAQVSAKLTDLS